MNIGFVGAGKVGCAFGKYLYKKGFKVKGYYSKSKTSAMIGAKGVNGKIYEDILSLIKDVEIVFITTPDDAIEDVVNQIIQSCDIKDKQIFIHMSGAISSEILLPLKEKGAFIYSLHPLQSFSDIGSAYNALKDTAFSIEGDLEKIDIICEILNRCGNDYFKIDKDKKTLYHAGACVISNYLVTLLDYGFRYFKELNIDEQIINKALYPLIISTVENVKKQGTKNALTGPIARGDVKTVSKHIEGLEQDAKELLYLYKVLGLETLKLAKKEKLKEEVIIQKLEKILREV